jgi:hypothetical protein
MRMQKAGAVRFHLRHAENGINRLDTDVIALLAGNPEVLVDTLKHLFMAIAELDRQGQLERTIAGTDVEVPSRLKSDAVDGTD